MSNLPKSSVEFYTVPSQTSKTILLTVLLVVALLLILAVIIILASRYKKPCSGAPPNPINVEAGYIDNTQFRVKWQPQKDISEYTVYVGVTADFTRVQSIKTVKTNRSAANVTGLDRNKTYYIFVTATNACGESSNSDTIVFIYIAS